MSQLKKLAGETVWYGLSSIIGRIISYILTPLYTSVFLPGEYGIVTELYAYAAFFNVAFMYGMETAFFRFVTKEKEKGQEYFNLCVSSIITTSLIFSGIIALLAKPIMSVLDYEGYEYIIYWLAAILAIDSIYALPFARLRLDGKAKRFAFIRLFNVILAVGLNLFFLVFCNGVAEGSFLPSLKPYVAMIYSTEFNVKYVFLSNLLANATFIILLADQFKSFRYSFDFKLLKPFYDYGLPIMLMGFAMTTNEMFSRALLKYVLPEGFYPGQTSMDALGVFGACYKLSVFMMLGTQAFRYAAEPFFFSKAQEKDSPLLFSNVMKWFVIFNAFVFLAVTVNLEVLGIVFLRNEAYREGLYVVPFLLMGYLFWGIYYNLSVWFKVTDQTKYGAIMMVIGAVITLIANLLLIPVLGYFGSALTTMFTFIIMVVMSYLLGQKHFPVPYNLGSAFFYIGFAAILSYLFYQLEFDNILINFIIRNATLPLFMLVFYFTDGKTLLKRKV